mmetsp:Transcript_7684/g.13545  ORF Transcript_7684/g.13545 Transcript_7684/m.13545 type:complete len:141 (-) Transcript_7684:199-621(-)
MSFQSLTSRWSQFRSVYFRCAYTTKSAEKKVRIPRHPPQIDLTGLTPWLPGLRPLLVQELQRPVELATFLESLGLKKLVPKFASFDELLVMSRIDLKEKGLTPKERRKLQQAVYAYQQGVLPWKYYPPKEAEDAKATSST